MASREEVFTAKILINDQEAESKLKKLETQLEAVKKRRDEALRDGKIDVWKAANKEVDRLSKSIDKQKTLVKGLSDTLDHLSTAKEKELEQVIKAINRQLNSGAVERNSKEWNHLNSVLKDTKHELQVIRSEGQTQPNVWGKFFKFLNDSWGGVLIIFQSITGISQTIRGAVNDYAAMEEEMADVRKYTGMSAEQVRDLNEAFKEMDTRTSREELNQLAGTAGRLGISSKEALLEFVDAADKISVALGDDLGDGAVDQIGKLAMAFGEDDRLGLRGAMLATGSAINELAQNSSAKAGYLVDFTARVAGFGKQLGLTQAQIMGFGTVMDENMLRDEMASTAFGNMLTKMQLDTAKFARIAGKDVKEFTELLNTDANQAILTLADNLKKADPQSMMKMLDDMGLDGARAVGVLSTMADKIDDVRKHQKLANEAYNEATSVINEYAVMNDTAEARMDKVKKQFKEMTIHLGEQLLPVVKYTISSAGLLAKGLSILTDFVIKNWKSIVVLTSGIVAYQVAINIATIKEKVHAAAIAVSNGYIKAKIVLTKAWAVATTALGLVYDLLTGKIKFATFVQEIHNKVVMANPYVAAAAAVMALVAAIVSLTGRTSDLTRAQKALKEVTEQAESEIAGEKAELDALVKTARDKSIADETREAAIKKLQEKYPEYLSSLSKEKIYSEEAKTAIDKLTDSLMAEAKARILVQKIKEAEDEKKELEEDFFSGISGFWNSLTSQFAAATNAIVDGSERMLNALKTLDHASLSGWDAPTWIEENGYSTNAVQIQLDRYGAAVKSVQEEIDQLNEELREQVRIQAELKAQSSSKVEGTEENGDGKTEYKTEEEIKKELAKLLKLQREKKKILKDQADMAKGIYQEELACEMLSYRQGLTTYTDYMEERHNLTQNYYDKLKSIYGENSKEYKKALLQQEKDEQEYNQWKNKQSDDRLLQEKYEREHKIRIEYARKGVKDEDALNEALFKSDIAYLKQKQNLYKEGSKEWIDIDMQIQTKQRDHQFQLESSWMEKLSKYREEAGLKDYQRLQDIELKGVETFYDALVKSGQMTQTEYDAIVEHIKRKYAELQGQQIANNDIQDKASKGLDTAKKNAGVKGTNAGNDAATGIFSINQAISQQKAINEELKRLYGEDYENNREYQEAKRQLDSETMQQIVAGAQAAYSSISSLISAASSYSQACSELETAKITADYDRQIEAAGNNSKKKEKLEKERDKKIAKAKTEANKKAMVMEMAQAVAQTALGAISAYSSTMAGAPYPANLVLAPISAGIALAAGALQIAAIKKQHEAESVGYYEGGFTGGSRYHKEAGIVHEGEFVANHQTVNNPQLLPVLNLIDQAQRNNRVGSLRAEDVTNVMGGPAAASVVAPVINVENDNKELREALEAHRTATDKLLLRLDEPIDAQVVLTGPNGLNEKQKQLKNILKNK